MTTIYKHSSAHKNIVAKLPANCVAKANHSHGIRASEPMIILMDSFYKYAENYSAKYEEDKLCDNYVLGPQWLKGINGVRAMFDGEGDFDCGTLEALYWEAIKIAGFTEEETLE